MSITQTQFRKLLGKLNLGYTEQEKSLIAKFVDPNNENAINCERLVKYLRSLQPKINNKKLEIPKLKFARKHGEIKGLNLSLNQFPEDSLDYAILKLKMYTKNNSKNITSIEATFQRLDEEGTGGLKEPEFKLAIDRLRLGFSDYQTKELLKLADLKKDEVIDYNEFISTIYDYEFKESKENSMKIKAIKEVSEEEELKESSATSRSKRISLVNPIDEIQNYEITASDYFDKVIPKCTTILNTEIAALKRCVELVIRSRTGFIDPDFGPEKGNKGASYLY